MAGPSPAMTRGNIPAPIVAYSDAIGAKPGHDTPGYDTPGHDTGPTGMGLFDTGWPGTGATARRLPCPYSNKLSGSSTTCLNVRIQVAPIAPSAMR